MRETFQHRGIFALRRGVPQMRRGMRQARQIQARSLRRNLLRLARLVSALGVKLSSTIRVCVLLALFALARFALAQAPAPASSPSLEQRVADLEAYVNNSNRTSEVSAVSGSGPGHNAWMMTATALVLFMTLPGLALFYGGLVRQKNVLSILAQCLGIAGLVTILWWAIGYSLVFAPGCAFFGSARFAFLRSVTAAPNTDYSYWISHNVFAMYQLMFA